MNITSSLLAVISERETMAFAHFLKKRNKRKDAKNLELLASYVNNTNKDFKATLSANVYNSLNKRLNDSLIDFIASRSLESEATDESEVIKLLLIARKLYNHKQFKLAENLLKKAKAKAINLNQLSLLNEIYHLAIEYSYLNSETEQNILIADFNKNLKLLEGSERRNIALAQLKLKLKKANITNTELSTILISCIKSISSATNTAVGFKDLLQIAEIFDLQGSELKSYSAIHLFFIDELNKLKKTAADNEFQLKHHIKIHYLIAHIYFRQRIFAESLIHLNEMELQMNRFNAKHYEGFKLKLASLKALNLNFTGKPEEAISIVDNHLKLTSIERDTFNLILSRIMIAIQQEDLKKASLLFSKLQQTDKWFIKNLGLEWLLQLKLMEILLHIEMQNFDFVDSRINSFIRTFENLYRKNDKLQVINYLRLVKTVYRNPNVVTGDKFKKYVADSLTFKSSANEDLFIMCFYAWLKAKMKNQPLYETTLAIVNHK